MPIAGRRELMWRLVRAGAGGAAAAAAAPVLHLILAAGASQARAGDGGCGALPQPGARAHWRHLHLPCRAPAGLSSLLLKREFNSG